MDVLGVFWGNFSLEYERAFGQKVSGFIGAGYPGSGVVTRDMNGQIFTFQNQKAFSLYGGGKFFVVPIGTLEGLAIRPQIAYGNLRADEGSVDFIIAPEFDQARRNDIGLQTSVSFQKILAKRLLLEPIVGIEYRGTHLKARSNGSDWVNPSGKNWTWELLVPVGFRVGVVF